MVRSYMTTAHPGLEVYLLPSLPTVDAVGREAFSGNIWVHERLDALHLRFEVDGGALRFGDTERPFRGEVPLRYRAAVHAVRERFDVGVLYDAVEDPAAYTFVCDATVARHLPYDWSRLPAAVGVAVYDTTDERWLAPDVAHRVFDHLGVPPLNTFEREVAARHFYVDRYDVPDSAWYDGPPAGIIATDKNGTRAFQYHESFDSEATVETDRRSPAALAEAYITEERVRRVARGLAEHPFDATFERVLESVFRETTAELAGEERAFRETAADRFQAALSGLSGE
jgi:hypothetical protein